MKKLIIYPFNKRVSDIARYREFLNGYELIAAVSPKGYGYDGKDISSVDGGKDSGFEITDDFDRYLEQCDCILFSKSTFKTVPEFYEEQIQSALKCGKEVLITKELEKELRANSKNIPSEVKILGSNPIKAEEFTSEKKYLKEIAVPVIMLFSFGDFCNGIDAELLLGERFVKDGYKVTRVTTNTHGELFGMHVIPDYMHQDNISVEDKIINFNHFIDSISRKEDSDLIIIDIMEAIGSYNDRITNKFGIIPYMISNAVEADLGILNHYYGILDEAYFAELGNRCKYRFNVDIKYYNISNTKLVINEFSGVNPISYITVDNDVVLETLNSQYKDYGATFFSSFNQESIDISYEKILEELTGNPAVVSIW